MPYIGVLGFGPGVQPLILDARGDARPAPKRNQTRVVLQSGFVAALETKGLARLGVKSLVGDIPCLLHGVQPASVVTTTNVKALQFSCTDYEDKISQYADLKKAFTHMCKIRAAFIEQRWQVSNGNAREADAVDMSEMFDRQTAVIKDTWRKERLKELQLVRELERRLAEEGSWGDPSEEESVWTENGDDVSLDSDSPSRTLGGTSRASSSGFATLKVGKKRMTRRSQLQTTIREMETEDLLAAPEPSKSILLSKSKSCAIIQPKVVASGPPEVTFEMVFQQRVKKNPQLNRHKLLQEFRRRLVGEEKDDAPIQYAEPLDPFER